MANLMGIDHKYLMASALAVTTGVAAFSTYKLLASRRAIIEEDNVYESTKSLQEYMVFHYGSADEILRWDFGPKAALDFPKRCADICMKYYQPQSSIPNRALDIGCAVGRHSFELARQFDEVVGIDYSQSFVDACNSMKVSGKMTYSILLEGDLYEELEAVVDPSLDRSRTRFQQGDACCLPRDLGQFGCVLAANLICRLHTPKKFLQDLSRLVALGGTLVITSPYSFLREFTPRSNWVGAYKTEAGEKFTGFDGLKSILGESFEFVAEENMPFFIRETARKNQWTVAHATIWKRKN